MAVPTCCYRKPERAFLATACEMLMTGMYCWPHRCCECWPTRAKGGSRLARLLCGHCPPFTGCANRETLGAGRTSSVDGSAVVPLSEPDFVGLTNGRASTYPLTVSRTTTASSRSKLLRSASIMNRGCILHSTISGHNWYNLNVKASFYCNTICVSLGLNGKEHISKLNKAGARIGPDLTCLLSEQQQLNRASPTPP